MIDAKRVKVLGVLGYNFGWHLLRSLIPHKKENQAGKFKGYFQKDWITAFTKEEIELVYNFSNCTVCGLCPVACLPGRMSRGSFLGPEHLAACAGRSQPEYIYDRDDFFRCTLCAGCEPACPEQVKISEIAWLMRKWVYRVEPSQIWSLFPEFKKNLDQFGNPFGKEKTVPGKSGFAPEAGRAFDHNKRALFLGCREMVKGEPEKWMAFAQKIGIQAELITGVCCGGFLEEIGAEKIAPGLEKLISANPQEVITVCPHCFYRLSRKLPNAIRVKFILELIPENVSGKPGANTGRAMYHDPCFLGRRMGMMDLPRNIIKQLGYELLEFSRSKELAECCGGGGGLPWYDPEMAARISKQRVSEAKKLGAKMIITECGLCRELMQKAGEEDKIEVKRLTELLF